MIIGGSPDQEVEDCITGDIPAGCDGYFETECVYTGVETAFTGTPGQVANFEGTSNYETLLKLYI